MTEPMGKRKAMPLYFFHRNADGPSRPGGVTVSKRNRLPAGDFGLTEYKWGWASLWFIDGDNFTASERQEAYQRYFGGRTT